jgi:hypothetical protein
LINVSISFLTGYKLMALRARADYDLSVFVSTPRAISAFFDRDEARLAVAERKGSPGADEAQTALFLRFGPRAADCFRTWPNGQTTAT